MNIILLFLYSMFTILILEYISKKTFKKVLMLKTYALFLNVLILMDIFLLIGLVIKNFQVSLIIVVLTIIIFGIANSIKIDYRQTGFTPLDFLILREAKSMAGALDKKSLIKMSFTAVSSLLVLLLISNYIKEPYLNDYFKAFIIILSIGFTITIYLIGPIYNEKISVFKSGSIFYFFSYLNNPPKIKIDGRKRNLPAFISNEDKKIERPDIIIIQSESFIDPYILGYTNFNMDPLPFYRYLSNECCTFSMSTRAFGGGTVHTEYEILTGLSTVFFPRDTTVFSRYIKKPLPSLGSILHKQGYKSLLIHPYLEWYYNRANVYKKLGFDKFLSIKSFPAEARSYVKDIDVFKRIINELDGGNNLVVAVTMQNHTPYNNNLFENGIKYNGDFRNSQTKIHFNNYLNGLSETDKSLSFLIEELKKREKETILLFYGDHLPVINQDSTFYEETRWTKEKFDSSKYYYDLSKSPGFLWSSRGSIKNNHLDLDATAVFPLLLKELKINSPEYCEQLEKIMIDEGINGFFRDFLVKEGKYYDSNHIEYKKIYNNIRDINNEIFNDSRYDFWCFENDKYEVV